jgi:hypothetical protein
VWILNGMACGYYAPYLFRYSLSIWQIIN